MGVVRGFACIVSVALFSCFIPRADAQEETANFHHVHLNVTNPQATIDYYVKFFSAVPVKFRGVADALLVDRAFILMTKVDQKPPAGMDCGIYHLGWGGVDGPSEFEWRKKEGMRFQTDLTPLGNQYYMYAYGPDDELVEIWTGFRHNRFGHVHLFADDVNATTIWYIDNLGLEARRREVPRPEPTDTRGLWANAVRTGGVTINVFSRPADEKSGWWRDKPVGPLQPTKGRVVDHMGFSYRKIEPVFERMKKAGLQIVEPIAERPEFKMKSFFVMGPDGVLIEIVEEQPLPEGAWE